MRICILILAVLFLAGCSEEKNAAEKAVESTKDMMGTVSDKLDDAIDKVDGEGPLEEMGESMDEAAESAGEKIGEAADTIKEKASAAADQIQEKADAVKKKMEDARSG